jgi:alpha-tubulin suppressor-like RCC1 family protein
LLVSFFPVKIIDSISNNSNSNQIVDISDDYLNIKFIELGSSLSAALISNGRVFTWGSNSSGRLGDNSTNNRIVPTEITSNFNLDTNDKIVSLSLSWDHSAVISSSGRVFTWGRNNYGQLGDNTILNRSVPTEITSNFNLGSNDKIVSLSLGYYHSSAVSSNGRIFTWGDNGYGKIGDGATTSRLIPTEITSNFNLATNDKIIALSLGWDHSSAVSSTGRIFTWGRNGSGQLGDGTTTDRLMPTEITSRFALSANDKIISLSLSGYNSSALSSSGRIFGWGDNNYGQIGDGTTNNRLVPTEITSRFSLTAGDKIISLSLGGDHSSAVSSAGRIFTWGRNSEGQLGDGAILNRSVPTEITSRFSLAAGDKIVATSLGSNHSSAISSSGRLFTWGFNGTGQLGNGNTNISLLPTEIIIKD